MIYQIKPDGFKFKEFYLDPYDIVDFFPEDYSLPEIINFYQHNIKMGEYWKTPNARFVQIKDMRDGDTPDIAQWLGGSLVLSPKAFNVLKDFLVDLGELLPMEIDGTTYYLFNCFAVGVHDEINSRKRKTDEHGVLSSEEMLLFNSIDVKDKIVFKTKLNNYSRLYCTDKFKNLILTNGLTGITFDNDLTNAF